MDVQTADILPDSRTRDARNVREHRGLQWVQLFCASCGTDKGGGWVPVREHCNFACYICEPCYARHGAIAGTMVEPDVAFWDKVRAVQLEEFGRELTALEIVEALTDGRHVLTKLARERPL